MARKRAPEHDWICQRCECPCEPPVPDAKHVGGGQGMRACKREPTPILRRDFEANMQESVQAAMDALAGRLTVTRDRGL